MLINKSQEHKPLLTITGNGGKKIEIITNKQSQQQQQQQDIFK